MSTGHSFNTLSFASLRLRLHHNFQFSTFNSAFCILHLIFTYQKTGRRGADPYRACQNLAFCILHFAFCIYASAYRPYGHPLRHLRCQPSRLRARAPRGLNVHWTFIQYPRFRFATPEVRGLIWLAPWESCRLCRLRGSFCIYVLTVLSGEYSLLRKMQTSHLTTQA